MFVGGESTAHNPLLMVNVRLLKNTATPPTKAVARILTAMSCRIGVAVSAGLVPATTKTRQHHLHHNHPHHLEMLAPGALTKRIANRVGVPGED